MRDKEKKKGGNQAKKCLCGSARSLDQSVVKETARNVQLSLMKIHASVYVAVQRPVR